MDQLPHDPELDDLVRRLNQSVREDAAREGGSGDRQHPGPAFDARLVGDADEPAARPEWTLPRAAAEGRERLAALLTLARQGGASDLFLVAGQPPTARAHDQLRPLGQVPLDAEELTRLAAAIVPPERRARLASYGSVDLTLGLPGMGRFRCNVHRERGQWAVAARVFPLAVPTLESLDLPAELARLTELRHGLLLVTGPTGSGKSTTLAALVALIAANRRAHIITIEDPVEYEHRAGNSLVEQIEIGRDAPSFASALRAALRQDPDVLMVGEMRDPETIAISLTAAETGHLVLSTLHTGDAAQTISRIVDAHPSDQSSFIRSQLAASLAAVVSQQLLPRTGGGGRVPAVELLLATDAVRNLVHKGSNEQLKQQIALSRQGGMRTFEFSLAELVRRGLVDRAEARARSRHPQEFDLHMSGGKQP